MSLSVFMGRFWWCLEVHENSASISRIVKRRGKPAVDCTFSGTLEACRNYQNVNGGSAEGVILIDDVTPVKVVFEKESFTLPGFETENFEFVDSVSGDFTVVAAKKSVVIYNHRCRKKWDVYTRSITEQLRLKSGLPNQPIRVITFPRFSVRDYFIISATPEHDQKIQSALRSIGNSVWNSSGMCKTSAML